ncbi:Rha family transcriptional regulator [Cupriavidus pinatubonensis]|uniref:Rha family transcriptional regulator n=1 Tax=Cupriavidus pinatubonensis TaxID=248026 RepID=UPI001CC7906C|nr:Rha family transcriptional regulator [Cupriavidus pinatubonensis]
MTAGAVVSLGAAGALTMSSREIAELVDSRHDKVKQSIERLAERGVITLPPLGEVSNPGLGPRTITEYRVGKRDSYVIVAQLSPEFTARLVDRWQELEAQATAPALPNFSDPIAAARAWPAVVMGRCSRLQRTETPCQTRARWLPTKRPGTHPMAISACAKPMAPRSR